MRLVIECQRIISECNPKFWVIENPATWLLKKHLWNPDYVYQPWEFWSPWTKKTALWWNFNKPKKIYKTFEEVPNKIPELYIRPWRDKPNMVYLHKSAKKYIREFDWFDDVWSDMEFRSLCSQKFAQHFFNINK
jgi:site-specific DNA-cytosine methylase